MNILPGAVVSFLLGWDPKAHPVVTGTVRRPYALGAADEWVVEYPSPTTGQMQTCAVREAAMRAPSVSP